MNRRFVIAGVVVFGAIVWYCRPGPEKPWVEAPPAPRAPVPAPKPTAPVPAVSPVPISALSTDCPALKKSRRRILFYLTPDGGVLSATDQLDPSRPVEPAIRACRFRVPTKLRGTQTLITVHAGQASPR